jgi:hypothetical protein
MSSWRSGLGTCRLHMFCISSCQNYCGTVCLGGCGMVVAYLRCSSPAIEERHLSTQRRLELVTSRVRSLWPLYPAPFDCSRAAYPMGTLVSFLRGKAAGAWSWPLTSKWYWGQENVVLYVHSPIRFHGVVLSYFTFTHCHMWTVHWQLTTDHWQPDLDNACC